MKPLSGALAFLIPALLLAGAGVWLLAMPAFQETAPTQEDWESAAAYVQEQFEEGDFIRIEPFWMTSGRVHFAALDGGESKPFAILDFHRVPDRPHLAGFKRVWLVVAAGEGRLPETVVPPGSALLSQEVFSTVTVFLFEMPEGMILWQMLDNLPPPATKKELRQVAGGARECVLVSPGKEPVTVAFRVPSPGLLLVRVGNTVEAARSKKGGPVAVFLSVDGRQVADTVLERRAYGLDELRASLDGEGDHRVSVRFATDDPRGREVCMDGYVVRAELSVSDENPGEGWWESKTGW